MNIPDDLSDMLQPTPRKRPKPDPLVKPVLQREVGPVILDRKEFDSGSMHGRWQKRGPKSVYEVTSYNNVIAEFHPRDDNPMQGQWRMIVPTDPPTTLTTRRHMNIVQRAINRMLYSA